MRDQPFYKKIIEQATMGYAYHQIITDQKGVPCDYRFLEVNQAFEEITGLDAQRILGEPVTKVLPDIEEDNFDWIGFFGEVALKGKQKNFTRYSEPLKRWYKGNTFSPEPGYFVVTVTDVTNERAQIRGLEKISETSESFLKGLGGEIPYQQLTDTLLELSGAKFAAFNLYNDDGKKYRTVATAGDRGNIKKAVGILGMKLDGKEWDHDPHRIEKIKDQSITRFSTLHELTGEVIPKRICDLITKTFGIGETVLAKIQKNDVMLGDFTFLMPKGKPFRNDALVEMFGRQLGMMIDRGRMEETIKETNENQRIFLEISTQLMGATSGTLDAVIEETMEKAAKIANADRVYLFEYEFEHQVCNNTYEWCGEGIKPQIHKQPSVPLEDVRGMVKDHQQRNTVIIDDVAAMPTGDSLKAILDAQSVKSLIAVPLFLGEILYGFIGFDAVKSRHRYSTEEKVLLQQYGNDLVSTISRIRSNRALRDSEKRNRFIVENISDMIWMMDLDLNITYCNDSVEKVLGYSPKEFKALEAAARYPGETLELMKDLLVEELERDHKSRDLNRSRELIIQHSTSSGKIKWLAFHLSFTRDSGGNPKGLIGVARDITESKEQNEKIEYLSLHDHLTGLYNRRYFEAELKRLDTERNLPITVIMGDVNGLKLINDTFGHEAGDELLVNAAQMIREVCRKDEIIARTGGDECGILLPNTDGSEAERLIDRIQQSLKKMKVKGMEISVSFGYGTKTDEGENMASVLKKAEDQMYANKLVDGPSMRGQAVEKIIEMIRDKSPGEEIHAKRVSELCVTIGEALGMKKDKINELNTLGLLHDIGKSAISDKILNKPGPLNEEEYTEIRRHPEIGYRILSITTEFSEIAHFVLAHHERWDGKGYPKGLEGEEIPLQSRICSIANAYEVMTRDQPYRSAMPIEAVLEELKNNAGTQFDPELVKVFIRTVKNRYLM